jgi:CheY-like chemotaxis protein
LDDSDVRVLVVDDLDDGAQMLAALLSVSGYATRTARDGASALAVTEEFKPHCALLDVKMPGMDGLELAQRLRARYGDDIVLIAVTGADIDDLVVSQTFELVDHYLVKPLDIAKLATILPLVSG